MFGNLKFYTNEEKQPRVIYYYDYNTALFQYTPGHPMKPFRLKIAHSLILNYGLARHMQVMESTPATFMEMTRYHTDEYIEYLMNSNPKKSELKFGLDEQDCPLFDGVYEYCSFVTGASLCAARQLNENKCDIAINWAGGMAHARSSIAAGFCYVNDIVLCIIELLKDHPRVMFLSLDHDHPDAVEEAFYTTDRVLTLSFHNFGNCFPGTGHLYDMGSGKGAGYAVNVPLRDGITDDAFKSVFQPIVREAVSLFSPDVIVMLSGASSIAGDRLGRFNLSLEGHSSCITLVRSFRIPILMLGGGGYTLRNVARAWALDTSILVNYPIPGTIPENDHYHYFGPTYTLEIPSNNRDNLNTVEYLDMVRTTVLVSLSRIKTIVQ